MLLLALSAGGFAENLSALDKRLILQASRQAVPLPARIQIVGNARRVARVEATAPGTDPATLYLRPQGGRWRVIAGPGTGWSPAELNRLDIPKALR